MVTRPDVAYAASILSEFNKNPSPQHLEEANHVIAYLYSTRHLAIKYCNQSETGDMVFQASSDASFADDPMTRKSTQGYMLSLFNQMGLDIEQRPIILCDNQQTVNLINGARPQITTKLKHVDIHHH